MFGGEPGMIETKSGVSLRINGTVIFASNNVSYWFINGRLIRSDGEIEGEATTMKDAVAIVLAKYGGRKETING
jgi:hypothetical protein